MTIQAIETSYKGYRFRSRLEARWAVFFDHLDLAYQYEPQGFEVDGVRYLPDFYLPQSKVWVEVKGGDEALRNDVNRLSEMLDFGSPLPDVRDSADTNVGGLLILGEVPYISGFGVVVHPLVRHRKGLELQWAYFDSWGVHSVNHYVRHPWDEIMGLPPVRDCIQGDPKQWTTQTHFLRTERAWNRVLDAYRTARSARFEFGQSGAAA